MTQFGAVILAAGFSSRMKAFKPLLPLGNITVLEHVLQTMRQAEITPVVATGHNHGEIEALAQKLKAATVHNPLFEHGMFTSIQSGFAYMADMAFGGVFLLPADIPMIRFSTLTFLQADFLQNHALYELWQPTFNGRRGHPPLLKMDLVRKIAALQNDTSLREALATLPENRKCKVSVCDRYILRDMDYPADYAALLAEYANHDVLYPAEAYALLRKFHAAKPKLIRHSLKVMQVALRLALALQRKNVPLNVRLVQSCALLHDIGKGHPDHACFAAELLASLELPRMGYVTGCHSGFALSQGLCDYLKDDTLAAKVVFIADKFVGSNSGDSLGTVDERFEAARKRFDGNPEAARRINHLHNEAKCVCAEISTLLNQPIDDVVFRK